MVSRWKWTPLSRSISPFRADSELAGLQVCWAGVPAQAVSNSQVKRFPRRNATHVCSSCSTTLGSSRFDDRHLALAGGGAAVGSDLALEGDGLGSPRRSHHSFHHVGMVFRRDD